LSKPKRDGEWNEKEITWNKRESSEKEGRGCLKGLPSPASSPLASPLASRDFLMDL
jgi:hypothetical protein